MSKGLGQGVRTFEKENALFKNSVHLRAHHVLRGSLFSDDAAFTVTSSYFAKHREGVGKGGLKIPDVTRVGIKALRGNMNTSFKCK